MSLQGGLSIERMCQLARVSRASFYRSLQEAEPDQAEMELRAEMQTIFLEHRRRYGYRRITAELRRRGYAVNRKRVQRLLQEDNLLALQPRAYRRTTDSRHELKVHLNLARHLHLTGINQLWVADITYIRLQKEFVYLAVVLDAHSRTVVGWALDTRLFTALPKAALAAALQARQPGPGLIHHSDRGVQYASREYMEVLERHGIIPSMSRPGNPYDNASCESWMKTLKQEEIYAHRYRDLADLRAHLEEFIDHYYNRCRLHSALGYRTPEEFERQLGPAAGLAGPTLSFFRHREDYRPDAENQNTRSGAPAAPPPIGYDESPTGYSLVSCSPAALTSASPASVDGAASARS
jgi:transposase InsO family protein